MESRDRAGARAELCSLAQSATQKATPSTRTSGTVALPRRMAHVRLGGDLLLLRPREPQRSHRRYPSAGEVDALGERQPGGRDVLLHRVADEGHDVEALDLQELQPVGDGELLQAGAGAQELGPEPLELLVLAPEEPLDLREGEAAQRLAVLLLQQREREAPDGTAPRLEEQRHERVERVFPHRREIGRRLQIGELLPGAEPETARLLVEHRRVPVEDVHEAPGVEQTRCRIERLVAVEGEREAHRASVARGPGAP